MIIRSLRKDPLPLWFILFAIGVLTLVRYGPLIVLASVLLALAWCTTGHA